VIRLCTGRRHLSKIPFNAFLQAMAEPFSLIRLFWRDRFTRAPIPPKSTFQIAQYKALAFKQATMRLRVDIAASMHLKLDH
jgi:hypothetical protein